MGGEFDAEGFHDAKEGGESGIASRGEGFVEGFARDAGLAGELGHSHGARDVAKGRCDQGRVAILEGGFEISGDGLRAAEILRGVPRGGSKSHFEPPLQAALP